MYSIKKFPKIHFKKHIKECRSVGNGFPYFIYEPSRRFNLNVEIEWKIVRIRFPFFTFSFGFKWYIYTVVYIRIQHLACRLSGSPIGRNGLFGQAGDCVSQLIRRWSNMALLKASHRSENKTQQQQQQHGRINENLS